MISSLLSWVVRSWFLLFCGAAYAFFCLWETGQWSWRARWFIAFTRFVALALVLVPLVVFGLPLLHAIQRPNAVVTFRIMFVPSLPSRPAAPGGLPRLVSLVGSSRPVAGAPAPVGSRSVTPVAPGPAVHSAGLVAPVAAPVAVASSAAGLSVLRGPSLSIGFMDAVLEAYHSPAAGTGWELYSLSKRYGIDDAFALAFFWHESNFGVNGEAALTHSLGNLRCIAAAACIDQERGGYAAFPDWGTGYAAWFALMAGPVYAGRGLTTVQTIIPVYAPTADHNDEQAYIANVSAVVAELRAGSMQLG